MEYSCIVKILVLCHFSMIKVTCEVIIVKKSQGVSDVTFAESGKNTAIQYLSVFDSRLF